jgi:hypothetical protein
LNTAPEGSYRAIVQFKDTVNMDKVLDRMMERDPGITREVAQAAVQLYQNTVYAYILDGHKVVTQFGIVGVSVKGKFERQTDSFDSSRHSIEATISPGVELRRIVREKGQVQQQEANISLPNPLEYVDLPSGQFDSVATPGRVAQVNGYRLKFDEADPTQGIFFIAADGSAARAGLTVKNTPRELIFEVPADLTTGDYTVEIRSTMGNGHLRVGRLPATLTVA